MVTKAVAEQNKMRFSISTLTSDLCCRLNINLRQNKNSKMLKLDSWEISNKTEL
jgi:hypothetical protein